MMLRRLAEYAARCHSKPLFYESTPIAWIVDLATDGRPLPPYRPVSQIDKANKRAERGKDTHAPEVVRSSATRPLLLADKGDYTFGIADPRDDQPESAQQKADQRHEAYLRLLDECCDATGEPTAIAVQKFYGRGGCALLDMPEDWDQGHKTTFRVHLADGRTRFPIDVASVQQFWADRHQPTATGQCVICGEVKPVWDRLPGKIKGIPGGQSAGTSVISANKPAFGSYGLEASLIAPTCTSCAVGFTRGLNALLSDPTSSIAIGAVKFVFWLTEEPADEFDLASFLDKPTLDEVQSLFSSPGTGRPAGTVEETAFCAASLTASGGRAVIRDWIDTPIADARANLRRWFDMQRIVHPRDGDPSGQHPEPLSVWQLARSTVREIKDVSPVVPRALVRTAISGAPLPMDIAYQAVRRNRAEQDVTHHRAALIKLVLASRPTYSAIGNKEAIDSMTALDPDHPDDAYHCGRLLAALAEAQRKAMPGVSASLVDRFYGAASSAPATVFGRLVKGAQPHLAKISSPAAKHAIERRIGDICERIGEFPRTLSLTQQAVFALGYYHERSHGIAEAKRRRAAAQDDLQETDSQQETDQ